MTDPKDVDQLRIGGLMRCCTGTLNKLYPNGPAKIAAEGQVLQCEYAPDNPNHGMIFRDGAWEWDRRARELCAMTAPGTMAMLQPSPSKPITFPPQKAGCQCDASMCMFDFRRCDGEITAEDLLCDFCRAARQEHVAHCHSCKRTNDE